MVAKSILVLSAVVLVGTVASMLLFLRTLQLKSRKMSIGDARRPRETIVNGSIVVKTRADCCDDISINSTVLNTLHFTDTNTNNHRNNSNNNITSSKSINLRDTNRVIITTNTTNNATANNATTSSHHQDLKGIAYNSSLTATMEKTTNTTAPPIHIPNCTVPSPSTTNTNTNTNASPKNPPPRKIFIDFGANDGKSVEVFLVGDLADKRNQALTSFNKNNYSLRAFAIDDTGKPFKSTEWDLHVFEANPRYTIQLLEQQVMLTNGIHAGFVNNRTMEKTQALLSKLHVESNTSAVKSYNLHGGTAITDHDGEVTFYLDNNKSGAEGSTTMIDSKSAVGRRITINATDIVTFFRTTLQARMEDYIVVKLDIEGAEYGLLRRMIDQCLLPLIDRIGVEWHHYNGWVFGDHPEDKGKRTDIRLKYTAEHARIIEALNSNATYDPQTGKKWMDKVTIWG